MKNSPFIDIWALTFVIMFTIVMFNLVWWPLRSSGLSELPSAMRHCLVETFSRKTRQSRDRYVALLIAGAILLFCEKAIEKGIELGIEHLYGHEGNSTAIEVVALAIAAPLALWAMRSIERAFWQNCSDRGDRRLAILAAWRSERPADIFELLACQPAGEVLGEMKWEIWEADKKRRVTIHEFASMRTWVNHLVLAHAIGDTSSEPHNAAATEPIFELRHTDTLPP